MRDFIVTSLGASSAVGESGCKPTFETKEANVENITVLDVMNATSNDTVAKLVKIWENKNAQRALRGAGLSTMALSLAACGGGSDPAPAEEVVEEVAVTPVALVLTDDRDIFNATDFTTGADTITGDADTLNATDVISEANDGDGDTLTIALGEGENNTAPASITGIENVVFNVTSFAAVTVDVDNIIGADITVNNLQLAGSAAADVDNLGATSSVTLGAGVTAASTVNTLEGWTGSVDVGSASQVTITAAAAADTITAVMNGDAALVLATAETAVVSATEASDVTLTIGAVTDLTGDANTTFLADLDAFDGVAVAGAAAVEGVSVNSDLTNVAVQINVIDGAGGATALDLADGASVSVAELAEDISFTAADDGAAAVSEQSLNLQIDADVAGAMIIATSATDDEISTVNLAINTNVTTLDLDVSDVAVDSTLNISGAGDATITITNGGGDLTINAAAATGALTMSAAADVLSVTGGSGDDTITAVTAAAFTIDGGAGDDTVVAVANMTLGTFTGFEILQSGAATYDFLASQLSGLDIIVDNVGGAGVLSIDGTGAGVADSVDLATIDLSGLVFADALTSTIVDVSTLNAGLFLNTQEFTITGSSADDVITGYDNDDTISGGAGVDEIGGGDGDDTITGGAGADLITGGLGADAIDLTEAVAAADEVFFVQGDGSAVGVAAGTFTGFDVVTGFGATDTVDFTADATAEIVVAQTGATAAANDLADADFADVDAVLAFLNDLAAANIAELQDGDIDVVAVTFSDFTALYLIDDAAAGADLAVGEIELIATVDDILVAADITI